MVAPLQKGEVVSHQEWLCDYHGVPLTLTDRRLLRKEAYRRAEGLLAKWWAEDDARQALPSIQAKRRTTARVTRR